MCCSVPPTFNIFPPFLHGGTHTYRPIILPKLPISIVCLVHFCTDSSFCYSRCSSGLSKSLRRLCRCHFLLTVTLPQTHTQPYATPRLYSRLIVIVITCTHSYLSSHFFINLNYLLAAHSSVFYDITSFSSISYFFLI